MLKKISILTLLLLTVGFSSCRKDADKEKPVLIDVVVNFGTGTLDFEWDGVEGAQHTIIIEGDHDPEAYEIAFNKLYEGYNDISKYSKAWLTAPNTADGFWTLSPGSYNAKVIANYDDGENVQSNIIVIGIPNFE